MKLTSSLLLAPLAAGSPMSFLTKAPEVNIDAPASGTGPYPATYTTLPSLSNHTIYYPTKSDSTSTLPLLIWGNGGCSANGTKFSNFLSEIASHGYIAIASGPPDGTGSTDVDLMKDALDWAVDQSTSLSPSSSQADTDSKPELDEAVSSLDTSSIAVAGQSCGGLEAYQMRDDSRVRFLGIFNSGFIPGDMEDQPTDGAMPMEGPETIKEVQKPVFYFLGGETDIAYENGERDYHALTGVPKWIGNYPVGHSGTYQEEDGGAFGVAAVNWLDWVLKGNQTAAAFFKDGGAEEAGWNGTEKSGLDKVSDY